MIAFGHPGMLWGLLGVPVLAVLVGMADVRHRRRLQAFSGALVERLVQGGGRRRRRAGLRILALAFLVIAAADPRFGNKVEELTQRGVDVLFVLDVSRSMMAEDVKPSRLAKAKAEIRGLAQGLEGERLGLVIFSGVSDTLCPMTLDRGAFGLFLGLADPGMIPIPGTDLGLAIQGGQLVLGEDDLKYKVMVLITDGEDHEGQGLLAAKAAAAKGIRIHTVNVGGNGAPLPGAEGFLKDDQGQPIFSKPDPEGLAAIAAETGGQFFRASGPRLELGRLATEIRSMEDRDLNESEVRNLEERFQWPLGLAIFLLLFELFLTPGRPKEGRRLA